ncbi:MAG: amidohydrolase family protein [Desulfobacteraceae bacterium]|nr:amidohydrolase family protein [Desulfobacteraceae bacterium]
MTVTAIKNIGILVSGDLKKGKLDADSIICENGVISKIGQKLNVDKADILIDAKNTTVTPGLIDSHCHTVFGDYTPRQKQVDFLASYVHGGVTSVVTASEGVHAPGMPHDPIAVKAFAIATLKCFQNFRPNGMKVNGGSVKLEPGLTEQDFKEMADCGVRYAKYGFGAYSGPAEGQKDVGMAQKYGMIVMAHSGGASLPGSSPIDHEALINLGVDVCGHINGGTTSLDDDGLEQVVRDTDMALQVVQAGNLRSALHILKLAEKYDVFHRVCIGSDTPTGTGVIPLGVIKTICELSSLGKIKPEDCIALATGNNSKIFGLATGTIEEGKPADLLICDAPAGSVANNALEAIQRGDIPGISIVLSDGQVQVNRSRNSPLANRLSTVTGQ